MRKILSILLMMIIVSAASTLFIVCTSTSAQIVVFAVFLLFLLAMPHLFRFQENLFEPITFIQLPMLGYISSSVYAVISRDGNILDFYSLEEQSIYILMALIYAICGLLSCYAGYFLFPKANTIPIQDAFKAQGTNLDAKYAQEFKRVQWIVLIASVLAIASYLSFIQSVGGLSQYWLYINRRTFVGGSRYLLALVQLLPISSWLFLVYSFKMKEKIPLAYLHLVVACVIQLSLGTRLPVIITLTTAFTIWWFVAPKRKLPIVNLTVLGIFIILVLTFVRLYRFVSLEFNNQPIIGIFAETQNALNVSILLEQTVATRDFTDVNIFAHIISATPDDLSFQYGQSFYQIPLYAIPRSIWPGKPDRLDVFIYKQLLNPLSNTGIPPSFVGELYLNFHILGIIVGMFLLGRAAYYLKLYLIHGLQKRSLLNIVLYSIICTHFFLNIIRANFDRAITSVAIVGVLFFCLRAIIIIRSPVEEIESDVSYYSRNHLRLEDNANRY